MGLSVASGITNVPIQVIGYTFTPQISTVRYVNQILDMVLKAYIHIHLVVSVHPRQEKFKDFGYGDDCPRGWYDVQRQGVRNDYCRWVGGRQPFGGCHGTLSHWSCALAGSSEDGTPEGKYYEPDIRGIKTKSVQSMVRAPMQLDAFLYNIFITDICYCFLLGTGCNFEQGIFLNYNQNKPSNTTVVGEFDTKQECALKAQMEQPYANGVMYGMPGSQGSKKCIAYFDAVVVGEKTKPWISCFFPQGKY